MQRFGSWVVTLRNPQAAHAPSVGHLGEKKKGENGMNNMPSIHQILKAPPSVCCNQSLGERPERSKQ